MSALFLSFLPPLDDIVALKDDHTPSAFGAASFGGWKVPRALDSWLLSLAPRPELTCPSCTAQCDLSWMGQSSALAHLLFPGRQMSGGTIHTLPSPLGPSLACLIEGAEQRPELAMEPGTPGFSLWVVGILETPTHYPYSLLRL